MNVGAEKGFQPTTNARNEAMLAEAGEFANHLRRCEKDIRGLKQTTEGVCTANSVPRHAAAHMPEQRQSAWSICLHSVYVCKVIWNHIAQ